MFAYFVAPPLRKVTRSRCNSPSTALDASAAPCFGKQTHTRLCTRLKDAPACESVRRRRDCCSARPLRTDNTISLSRHARPPIRTYYIPSLAITPILLLLLLLQPSAHRVCQHCAQTSPGFEPEADRPRVRRDQTENEKKIPPGSLAAVSGTRDNGVGFNPLLNAENLFPRHGTRR